MTLKGEGGDRNLTKALEYYENAANRSSPDALNGLGYMRFYGDNVPKNETTALSYFRRAADLGNGDGSVKGADAPRGSGRGEERHRRARTLRTVRADEPRQLYVPGGHHRGVGGDGRQSRCAKAAGRFRAVAESGAWTAPLAEGLKAHLAGDTATARWMYDKGADMGVPAARFMRRVVARRARQGRARRSRKETTTRRRRRRRRGGAVRDSDGRSATRRLAASGAASASALSRRAAEMCVDPATPPTDAAWASLARGDCEYYGASELGGCARRRPREALRHYAAAARHARAALAAGYADDAADAAARAKYSEAWMRRRRGCGGIARARAALIEGGHRGIVAIRHGRRAAPRRAPRGGRRERRRARARGRSDESLSASRRRIPRPTRRRPSRRCQPPPGTRWTHSGTTSMARGTACTVFVALEGSADARAVATAAPRGGDVPPRVCSRVDVFRATGDARGDGRGPRVPRRKVGAPAGADVAEAMHARIARMRAETREEPREEPREETEREGRRRRRGGGETETGREGEERGDAGRPREGERARAEGEAIVRAPEGSPPTEPSDEEEPGDEFETID